MFQDRTRASNKLECLPDARIRWLPVDMGSLGPRRGPTEGQNLAPPSRLRSCLFAYLSWPSRLAAWGLKSAERARMPCSSWDTECERGRGICAIEGGNGGCFETLEASHVSPACASRRSVGRGQSGGSTTAVPVHLWHMHASAGHTGIPPCPPRANTVDVPGVPTGSYRQDAQSGGQGGRAINLSQTRPPCVPEPP